jgi:hypothetical protein
MNKEPIKIIADIIKHELLLLDDEIYIYNQDFKVPNKQGLFVVIIAEDSNAYSANSRVEGSQETTAVLTHESYDINIMSKNNEARLRKDEVYMALVSQYAQQQQDLYQFRIAQIPNNVMNLSEIEGAGMLNRFMINVSVMAWIKRTKEIDYFDKFSTNTKTQSGSSNTNLPTITQS